MNYGKRYDVTKEDILSTGCFLFMGAVFVIWLALVILILYHFTIKYLR